MRRAPWVRKTFTTEGTDAQCGWNARITCRDSSQDAYGMKFEAKTRTGPSAILCEVLLCEPRCSPGGTVLIWRLKMRKRLPAETDSPGRDITAQANGLGQRSKCKHLKALKGRDMRSCVSPFQGSYRQTVCSPRPMAWAELLRPVGAQFQIRTAPSVVNALSRFRQRFCRSKICLSPGSGGRQPLTCRI